MRAWRFVRGSREPQAALGGTPSTPAFLRLGRQQRRASRGRPPQAENTRRCFHSVQLDKIYGTHVPRNRSRLSAQTELTFIQFTPAAAPQPEREAAARPTAHEERARARPDRHRGPSGTRLNPPKEMAGVMEYAARAQLSSATQRRCKAEVPRTRTYPRPLQWLRPAPVGGFTHPVRAWPPAWAKPALQSAPPKPSSAPPQPGSRRSPAS